MNNRDPYRGNPQQPGPPAPPQRPPPRRRPAPARHARPGPDPDTLPAPQPYRSDAPTDQHPRRSAPPPPPAETVPHNKTSAAPAPEPTSVRRQLVADWTAFDRLEEEQAQEPSAKLGWRKVLHALTRIKLGPNRDRSYELGLQERVRASVGSAFSIAVLNLKGGVGKTAVVETLGSTFAEVRGDRVIALDVDAGDLADRHGGRNQSSMFDVLAGRSITRYADVRAHTHKNGSRLEVLGFPDYAHMERQFERDDFVKAFSVLRKHYSVVLMDCPKALKSGLMEAVLAESRALVVVTSTSADAIKKTRTTLEWLAHNGYQKLTESTVLAINHTERAKPDASVDKELVQLAQQFGSRCVVALPFDSHVHEGKEISLERLNKKSRRRYLEMAAALADMFPRRGNGDSR